MMRVAVFVMAMAVFLSGGGRRAEAAGARKPAVLVYCGGTNHVSFPYLRQLHERGFQMDYTSRLEDLTWERLKKYNCVVLIDLYKPHTEGPDLKGTFALVDRFLAQGGGVFLLPSPHQWNRPAYLVNFYNVAKRYGIDFMTQQWLVDPGKEVRTTFFHKPFLYTDKIVPHPLTEGVSGLWYCVANEYGFCWTMPIAVSKPWRVLVRGTKSTHTVYGDQVRRSRAKEWKQYVPFQDRGGYEAEPPLFAVREFGPGRMAYMLMFKTAHFTDGLHRGVGHGLALQGELNDKRSCLGRLIENTLTWLSAPSLRSGTVGGYVQDPSRLAEPSPGPSPRVNWQRMKFPFEAPEKGLTANLAELEKEARMHNVTVESLILQRAKPAPFRGLIGAKTSLSSGKGTVEEFAGAARRTGLDYLVFLEDFANLSPENFLTLKAECKRHSDDKLLLVPGIYVESNIGHHMYLFGLNFDCLGKWMLTPDRKKMDFNPEAKEAKILPVGEDVFLVSTICNGGNSFGYFNFTAGGEAAPMYDLRCYNSVGLFYYRDGKLIEGMEKNFKDYMGVNKEECNISPAVIDQVASPQALAQAVAEGHMLTCAWAPSRPRIMEALKNDYNVPPPVYVSSGPVIRDWSSLNYQCATYAESFVTPNYRWRINCHVTSDVGLKEIKIYDGPVLFRRFLPGDKKEFHKVFDLAHSHQHHLILVATDVKGRVAVSGEQLTKNHMHMNYWCSDRQNGNMLWHGPYYFNVGGRGESGVSFTPKGFDSYGLTAGPGGLPGPVLESDQGQEEIRRFTNHNYPLLASEDVFLIKNVLRKTYLPGEKVFIAYQTYGPLVDTELMEVELTALEFRKHYARPTPGNPTVFGISEEGDIVPVIMETKVTFKKDMTVERLVIGGVNAGNIATIPGNKLMVAFAAKAGQAPFVAPFDDREAMEKFFAKPFVLRPTGWYAAYGSRPGGSTTMGCNVGTAPLFVSYDGTNVVITAGLAGKKVKQGDAVTFRILGFQGIAPEDNGAGRYRKLFSCLGLADGKRGYEVEMKRGRLLPVSDGLLDIRPADGAAEFAIPNPRCGLKMVLPIRVHDLNDRWSAVLYDHQVSKARPIGTYDGVGYARLDPEYAVLTHVSIGHPVTASNERVFLNFVQLEESPNRYHVSVNNPTDKTLRVKLRQAMDLPGFEFAERVVELAPGTSAQWTFPANE